MESLGAVDFTTSTYYVLPASCHSLIVSLTNWLFLSHLQEKVDVNGPSTHPVWKYLKGACATCDGEVTWNFKVGQSLLSLPVVGCLLDFHLPA